MLVLCSDNLTNSANPTMVFSFIFYRLVPLGVAGSDWRFSLRRGAPWTVHIYWLCYLLLGIECVKSGITSISCNLLRKQRTFTSIIPFTAIHLSAVNVYLSHWGKCWMNSTKPPVNCENYFALWLVHRERDSKNGLPTFVYLYCMFCLHCQRKGLGTDRKSVV